MVYLRLMLMVAMMGSHGVAGAQDAPLKVRFATQKYDLADLDNTYAHLTNTSINKHSTSYSTRTSS